MIETVNYFLQIICTVVCWQVKRGVVPPCPGPYSRKIYGSGPRFMSQDDGSDSEPELVVQPRGQWEKGVGVREM